MTSEHHPKRKKEKWEKKLSERRPELGKIVTQILDTRSARVGRKSSSGDEDDQFSGLNSSSLPATGGIRIVSDF